jgi:hypothetical protein
MLLGAALGNCLTEVELPIGLGGVTSYQILMNSEYCKIYPGSEGKGAKVLVRKGKNPDLQLRSQNIC